MQPYVADPDFTLWNGDVREVLPALEAQSVDCAVTSPPFYALRDYGCVGQIGLEATPDEWVTELVGVFGELRRVLKPRGTLWVECGDSYAADRTYQVPDNKHKDVGNSRGSRVPAGLKQKDLLLMPFELALALRADGWYLRQCIIWAKPNAMPESATDRCTTAHSYVFLLSKQARYHFDADAIAEDFSENTHSKGGNSTPKSRIHEDGKKGTRQNKSFADSIPLSLAPSAQRGVPQVETLDGSLRFAGCPLHDMTYFHGDQSRHDGVTYPPCDICEAQAARGPDGRRVTHVQKGENSLQPRDGERWPNEQRHPRSVWTIPTQGFPAAHFATWPESLVERIVKAGCPEGGTVLDPFSGSGTTALVARRLGRRSIGIELNPEYCAMAARRLGQQSLLAEASVGR